MIYLYTLKFIHIYYFYHNIGYSVFSRKLLIKCIYSFIWSHYWLLLDWLVLVLLSCWYVYYFFIIVKKPLLFLFTSLSIESSLSCKFTGCLGARLIARYLLGSVVSVIVFAYIVFYFSELLQLFGYLLKVNSWTECCYDVIFEHTLFGLYFLQIL